MLRRVSEIMDMILLEMATMMLNNQLLPKTKLSKYQIIFRQSKKSS